MGEAQPQPFVKDSPLVTPRRRLALARLLGMRVLLSRFFRPGLRRRVFLTFLRGRMLHLLNRTLHLRRGTLHLRRRVLHLLDRALHLRSGSLLRSRARRLLPDWCWVRLGGRP